MALVNVDVFSIATAKFRMTEFDSIADLKHLIEELIGIDHKSIVLKHSVANQTLETSTDELLIGCIGLKSLTCEEMICKLFMTSPTIAHLKIAHELRTLQDSVSTNEHKFFRDGVAVATKCFVSLASHKLFQNENSYVIATVLPSAPASSSLEVQGATATPADGFDIPEDMDDKKEMMTALQKTNAELEACVKDNKEKIKKLRDAIRASPIKVWLMRPSGEKFDITTQPDFTVSRLKKSIENVYGFDRHFARLISNDASGQPVEMKNTKRLFSYNILSDGDEIFFIMTGGNITITPVEDETADTDAHQSSSEDELEIAGTPPMSDDDAFQPPPPKDEDMRMVQVKDFASRAVMMYGKIDSRMDLKGLLNFMMEFENIEDEQKEQLIFTDSRGKAYSWSLTVQQCVDTTTFDGFYLKVSGLSGGALVRGHLTKQQMMDRFKKKSRDYIKQLKSIDGEEDEFIYDPSVVPQSIHDFMEEKRQQIANASFMASQGRCPILMALTSTPDDKLLTIQSIMQTKFHGKKDCSELRVVKSINLMFPAMAVIEQTKLGLTLLQKELSTSLMMLYANRYNEEFGGEVRYCHAGFLKALSEELIKRQVRPMAEPERGCTLC